MYLPLRHCALFKGSDISKTNINVARGFKLGQLIEDNDLSIFFANLDIENFHQDISKTIIARSFKLGQLVEESEYCPYGQAYG